MDALVKSKIKIIIADDHPIMVDGLNAQLSNAGYQVVATAQNGSQALELIANHNPDIAILDIQMPYLSGFDIVNSLNKKQLKTAFIVMTYHKDKGFLVQAKKFGFLGYLLKEDGLSEVEKCIEAVLNNELYYSASLTPTIKSEIKNELLKIKRLSPSERTIIRLVAQGKSSKEIGEQLSIALRTVQNHRSNIISKLNLEKGTDALTHWTKEYKDLVVLL